VGQAGADIVPGGIEGDLGLILQGAEGRAVDNALPVPLKLGPEVVGVFRMFATQAFPAFGGVRSQECGFFFFKIRPSPDRHKIVMDDHGGESRDGKLSDEQGVKNRGIRANKSGKTEFSSFEKVNVNVNG
jgi:hypothetical protein